MAVAYQSYTARKSSTRRTSSARTQPTQPTRPALTVVPNSDASATTAASFTPSKYQAAIFDFVRDGRGDGIVNAVAGSGKTTTLVQASQLLDVPALFLAFNKHIAEELAARLAGTTMIAKTLHSVGNAALVKHLGGKVRVDSSKVFKLARQFVEYEIVRQPGALQRETTQALTKLVAMARITCTDVNDAGALLDLCVAHNIDIDPMIERDVLAAVPLVIRDSERMALGTLGFEKLIDFDDMVVLPVKWSLPLPQYRWIFVDECQDLNNAQRKLAMACRHPGGRMLFVGDKRQAIYGFAGANVESFDAIQRETNATVLPLSICYRCPPNHLDLVRTIVPDIEAAPGRADGAISYVLSSQLADTVKAGDFVLCRLTAPLVQTCIQLISRRVPARVKGKDIGKQLTDIVRAVTESSGYDWSRFAELLGKYEATMIAKLGQRDGSESQIESLMDRVQAIQTCYESFDCQNANELIGEIDALFSDDRAGVTLSTVHRAKGLEGDRVFILREDKLPLIFPKQTAAQLEQEYNLRYVALTRSRRELFFVM